MDGGLQVTVPNGREIGEILRSLGRIEACLSNIKTVQEDQDNRIAALEAKANWAVGALAAFTFLFTLGLEFIKGFFK